MRFADRELAARLEGAEVASVREYVEAVQRIWPGAGAAAQRVGDGVAVFAGQGSPVNRVYGLGMREPVHDQDLEWAEAFFAAREEACRVDLCPLAHPSLQAWAMLRGYSVQQFKNVWWRDLGNDDVDHPPNLRFRIETVTVEQAQLWASTVSAGFAGVHNPVNDDKLFLPNVYKRNTVCFLAWDSADPPSNTVATLTDPGGRSMINSRIRIAIQLGRWPAGGGALAIHDGVAICFSTSVRPAMRRTGVQSALLRARLAHAAQAGCDLVTVSTTPGTASQRNVERFSFHLAYTKPTLMLPV